jgi:hypothetical protein
MLILEFDQSNDFITDLENVLKLELINYNRKKSPGEISYESLSQKLQKLGSYGSVNRRIIDSAIEKSEVLSQLIKSYDEDGIDLSTDEESPKDKAPKPDLEKTDQGISKTTQQAASRAAQKELD